MCGCVWEKKGLTCYQSDTKCIRAGEYINAGRTLHHKPLSTTEGQRVALVDVGSCTEIRDDSITSGHMIKKAEAIDVDWYLEDKTAHAI